MKRVFAAFLLLLTTICFSSSAQAQQEESSNAFYGLLRMRDLSPFGSLRLDMRPAHAVSIPRGTLAVELEVGYQNSWALSPELEKFLTARGSRSQGAGS